MTKSIEKLFFISLNFIMNLSPTFCAVDGDPLHFLKFLESTLPVEVNTYLEVEHVHL